MSIEIRQGAASDIEAVAQLYDDLTGYLESTTNYPGWQKGIYPARADAVKGIDDANLFVAMDNDEVVGSIILRRGPEQGYSQARWQAELDDSQVLVIHTFAVSPHRQHCGIGRQLLEFAERHAMSMGVVALRLDVYEGNHPAMRLYESLGYRYIDTISLGLECYGLDRFKLYEKLM